MGALRLALPTLLCLCVSAAATPRAAPRRTSTSPLVPSRLVEAALRDPASSVVGGIMAELRRIERNTGNNDGRLAPRDLDGADRQLRTLMERVYSQGGLARQEQPLEKIGAALPRLLARLGAVRSLATRDLLVARYFAPAQQEAIVWIGRLYRQEVRSGTKTPDRFSKDHRIPSSDWAALRAQLDPGATGSSAKSLDRETVAGLYRQVLDGKLRPRAFYTRAGLTMEDVQRLQRDDPEHFPRQEGARWGFADRREIPESEITALSRVWRARVVSGEQLVKDFCVAAGVSGTFMHRMRHERPAIFPDPPPRAAPPGKVPTDLSLVKALAERCWTEFRGDALVTRDDLVGIINADATFVARHGQLSISRYNHLMRFNKQQREPASFPPLRDSDQVMAALAREVAALRAGTPSLGRGAVVTAMRKRHPRFKTYHLSKLFELGLDPGFEGGSHGRGAQPAPRRALPRQARQSDGPRGRFGAWVEERGSAVVWELWSLVNQVAPPGTSGPQLGDVLNQLLVERGLPAYPDGGKARDAMLTLARRLGKKLVPEEQTARIVSQVVAEYAMAAPRGTPEAEILRRVQADYPALSVTTLGRAVARWRRAPRSFPSLAPFRSSSGLALSGQGRALAKPRFLGGWDVQRALLQGESRDALARASEYARIALRLPLLDKMVADLGGSRPLANQNVLWVTHLFASTYPLARALRAAGASVARRGHPEEGLTVVVGTPYGTNPAVLEAVRQDGFDVRVPTLSVADYRAKVKQALDDILVRHRANRRPVVVMDDGGLVAEILHSDPKYRELLPVTKIVEQTTRGITAAEQTSLQTPVVAAARARAKKLEGSYIGWSVAEKVRQGLRRLGRDPLEQRYAVVGYGWTGRVIANRLRRAGVPRSKITVVERSPERAAQARRAGFKVAAIEEALPEAQVVIGTTGERSLELAHLHLLRQDAVVCSSSSKQVEIDMEGLRGAASARVEIKSDSPLVRLPTYRYRLKGREITVLGDGWPVNFDGDVEDIPTQAIQITRALMFAGVLQAARLDLRDQRNRRVIPFDPAADKLLLERFRVVLRSERRRMGGIGDPDRWADVALGVARRFSR